MQTYIDKKPCAMRKAKRNLCRFELAYKTKITCEISIALTRTAISLASGLHTACKFSPSLWSESESLMNFPSLTLCWIQKPNKHKKETMSNTLFTISHKPHQTKLTHTHTHTHHTLPICIYPPNSQYCIDIYQVTYTPNEKNLSLRNRNTQNPNGTAHLYHKSP